MNLTDSLKRTRSIEEVAVDIANKVWDPIGPASEPHKAEKGTLYIWGAVTWSFDLLNAQMIEAADMFAFNQRCPPELIQEWKEVYEEWRNEPR